MTKMADRESLLQAFEPNCYGDGNVYRGVRIKDSETKTTYVEPQKKEWVGLTKEEANKLQLKYQGKPISLSAAVENLLREKNNGQREGL